MSQGIPTIPDSNRGMLASPDRLWIPPSIGYTWHDRAMTEHSVEDITRVDFTPHHVAFWRDEVLVLAVPAVSVLDLRQIVPEDPA